MTRLVIDASVLASAAVGHPDSPSARVLDAASAGQVEMFACQRLLDELDRALSGRYFTDRLTAEERSALDSLLRATAVILPDPDNPPAVLRDPDDDYIVALAHSAEADAIVTGDKDLLDHAGLKPPAITPRTACERFDLA